ncbi:MAG: ComF family protein [Anaerolineales bacterium]|nr:ComF family protein [Anaerolineales bacterium]
MRAVHTLLDWLFPPRCAGCGALGAPWCAACDGRARRLVEPLCACCGLPLAAGAQCAACKANHYRFDAARSWAVYDGELRQALLSLKRRRNPGLADALAGKLAGLLEEQGWQVDLVATVPLDRARLARRGFNQAALLAESLAAAAGLRFTPGALVQPQAARPQHELSAAQRWRNLQGSFVADRREVLGTRVLLVDDIMTTGATLDAAATALQEAGAHTVHALTVARSLFDGRRADLVR